MLYWPFMHAAFGLEFELHLAWVLLMGITMSIALVLLRRLGMESLHAGVIAALVLIFPSRTRIGCGPPRASPSRR